MLACELLCWCVCGSQLAEDRSKRLSKLEQALRVCGMMVVQPADMWCYVATTGSEALRWPCLMSASAHELEPLPWVTHGCIGAVRQAGPC